EDAAIARRLFGVAVLEHVGAFARGALAHAAVAPGGGAAGLEAGLGDRRPARRARQRLRGGGRRGLRQRRQRGSAGGGRALLEDALQIGGVDARAVAGGEAQGEQPRSPHAGSSPSKTGGSSRWQATQCPGSRSSRTGTCWRQRSMAWGQRV